MSFSALMMHLVTKYHYDNHYCLMSMMSAAVFLKAFPP